MLRELIAFGLGFRDTGVILTGENDGEILSFAIGLFIFLMRGLFRFRLLLEMVILLCGLVVFL
jgi:hypothetical protein